MIKNERQYRITKAQADRFERAIASLQEPAQPSEGMDPILRRVQAEALRSQFDDLRAELAEYEALQAGALALPELTTFVELPKALIQSRIALGLSQKELADRLGVKEQQVQRYEATDYAGASVSRVVEVIRALELKERVQLPDTEPTMAGLYERLSQLGFEGPFVRARLIPPQLLGELEAVGEAGGALVLQAAGRIAQALSIPVEPLLAPASTPLNLSALAAARFKIPARVDERRLNAYTVYAHHLALLLLDVTAHIATRPIPANADAARQALLQSGATDFTSLIRFIWDLGVPVLPLRDSGAFHGACWRERRRNVIVLKQRTTSDARWSFDALHELWHAAEHPELESFATIENDERDQQRWAAADEQAASQFAGDVLLSGRAEELAHRCSSEAGGYIPRLKTVVPSVARAAGVPVGAMANYMAYRLAMEGINWWPTATALQTGGPDAWSIARDVLLERADFTGLNDVDRSLLMQALTGEAEA